MVRADCWPPSTVTTAQSTRSGRVVNKPKRLVEQALLASDNTGPSPEETPEGNLTIGQALRIDPERAIKAVTGLSQAGILFAITSGRPPKGMKMLVDPLQLSEPISGFNGGVVVHPDLTVIASHLLDSDVASGAIRLIDEHQLDVWLYSQTDWFVRDSAAPFSYTQLALPPI